MLVPLTITSDGYEEHFAINALGHFRLIRRIFPMLVAAGATSISLNVTVGCNAHPHNIPVGCNRRWLQCSLSLHHDWPRPLLS